MPDITVSADLLARAGRKNCYAVPDKGMVFFGIRGLTPEHPLDTSFAKAHPARLSAFDFRRMRCTLGQWNVETGEIALFPGSTVPSEGSIAIAKKENGNGTNLLMPGRFEYQKGVHKQGKPGGHRAFRQASFQPVWRTADNLTYDFEDRLDFGSGSGDFVWDNIHAAYYENPEGRYSSAGCQVVCGLPKSAGRARETGPWRAFIDSAYAAEQDRFVYLLFGAEELAYIDKVPDSALKQTVRYGSSGPLAKKVQQALIKTGYLTGSADGIFGRMSLMALVEFQRRQLGSRAADGVCGEMTANALGVVLPTLAEASSVPLPAGVAEQSATDNPDLPDETDLAPDVLALLLAALGEHSSSVASEMTGAAGGAAAGSVVAETGQPSIGIAAESASRDNFERAQEIIRVFEGKYVDDPKDPGGATNFGITHKVLARWRGRPVSKAEVAAMPYEEAKAIYFSEYWTRAGCAAMPGPLALAVYNVAVHAGVGRAGQYLQKALNVCGAPVNVDGIVGQQTLGAIAKVPQADLIDEIIDLYAAKLRSHKEYAHFKKGFEWRITTLRAETGRWLDDIGGQAPLVPTPPIIEEEDPVVTNNTDEILKVLIKMLESGAPTPTPAVTDEGKASSPLVNLAVLLRNLGQRLEGVPVILPKDSAATNVLTPVNGALGSTLGKLLDGRKTGLGIIGALASTLLAPTTDGGTAATSPLGELIPLLAAIPGLSSIMMPISLALLGWGLLGKVDKYVRADKV